jgi:N-acetylmuramoyl-L-alanine amidase
MRLAPRSLVLLLALGACTTPKSVQPEPAPPQPVEPAPAPAAVEAPARERDDCIFVCGERVPIGVPVVLWTDPTGYDAYSKELRFPDEAPQDPPTGLRYQPGRKLRQADGTTRLVAFSGVEACREELAGVVDQFVLHYDVCGTSRQCFKILHDRRELSVHFLLDVDGTLYQTLDLSDTAWHARQANSRSVGIEIANIGAYPPGEGTLDEWYATDELGPYVRFPEWMKTTGIRSAGFVARPARPERITGAIHGRDCEMHDFTAEQYATLVKLAAGLCRTFPALAPDCPRDAEGQVRTDALSDEEFAQFRGILGHFHITEDKRDPGPAFDWERFLSDVRAALALPVDMRP